MDSDDLSKQTYAAVIETAENFHHDLTLQFGVLASSCHSDNEYLDFAEAMINEWLTDWEIEEIIADIFYDDPPKKKEFKNVLQKILSNIELVRKIPTEKRKFDLW
jgi:hypothetical protein